MKDMSANAKGLKGDADAVAEERKEKERKREEKELRRAAKAAGVKMAKPATGSAITPVAGGVNEGDAKSSGFKKSGWATVSSEPSQPAPSKGGWAPAGSSSILASTQPPPPPPPSSEQPPPPSRPTPINKTTAPSFRTAGWTSLDTGSSQLPPASQPPPPTPESYQHPPPPSTPTSMSQLPPSEPAPVRTGWQQFKAGGKKRR